MQPQTDEITMLSQLITDTQWRAGILSKALELIKTGYQSDIAQIQAETDKQVASQVTQAVQTAVAPVQAQLNIIHATNIDLQTKLDTAHKTIDDLSTQLAGVDTVALVDTTLHADPTA